MIKLRFESVSQPVYMTTHAAGADLRARVPVELAPGARAIVPTGVWIDSIEWDQVPSGLVPELQIRARSGLAWKHGITLMNGVGTVDADYPDEIGVILWNTGTREFRIEAGERVAQLVLAMTGRLPDAKLQNSGFILGKTEGIRKGGFGSTGQHQ
jgi:dUTP pyrophosphatase